MRASCVTAIAMAAALLAGACTKKSELYCAQHPDDTVNCADDPGPSCDVSADCASTPSTPVCAETDGVCVQCVSGDAAACSGTTPVCEGTTCRACTGDAECVDSNFCLPDGSCAAASEVAFVSENGAGDLCTQASPCPSLKIAADTNRPYIKVTTNVYSTDTATFASGVRVIHGAGTRASVQGGKTMFDVSNAGTSLEITGLEMTTTSGGSAPVIKVSGANLTLLRVTIRDASGSALDAQGASLVIIRRSIITNNTSTSPAISLVGGEYDITNTIIAKNGSNSAMNGGVRLEPRNSGTRKVFAFNTVASNLSETAMSRTTGIVCVDATVDSSIIMGNRFPGCTLSYTLWDTMMPPPAGMNMQGTPTFVEENAFDSAGFYRLAAGSLGIDSADPAATLAIDIDGQPRPVNDRSDMGVDEVQ